ncbi:MAG: hypothetical protein SOR53_00540 [Oscillospiraceae bacterium]|nr:hypothetical protein [Oscillospiraceae bacterium]
MKALTAKRAVLYQGRMYEPGDVLPAGDSRMVEAWLQAESAEWTGVAQGAAQEAQGEPGTDNGTQEGQEGQGAAEDALDAQEGQGAAEGTLDVVDGHLTRESLETMTKANLEKLAKDMGVEIPRGATKALIIERLAAVTVEAPAHDGGAQ